MTPRSNAVAASKLMNWLLAFVTTAIVVLALLFLAGMFHGEVESDSDHRRSRLLIQPADYDRPDLFGTWMVAHLRPDCVHGVHALCDSGQLLAAQRW